MIYFFIFFILIFFIIAFFSFPQFSPIPYFPSNKKDLPLILKALDIKNSQILFDLGAGDGLVIFEAAKEAFRRKLNTQFIAVEINPVLLCIIYIRRLFNSNKKNIRVIWGDIFKIKLNSVILACPESDSGCAKKLTAYQNDNITFYLYISPWHLEKTVSNIKKQIKHFSVVSYMYPIKSLRKIQHIIHGKNQIYIYPVFHYDRE